MQVDSGEESLEEEKQVMLSSVKNPKPVEQEEEEKKQDPEPEHVEEIESRYSDPEDEVEQKDK